MRLYVVGDSGVCPLENVKITVAKSIILMQYEKGIYPHGLQGPFYKTQITVNNIETVVCIEFHLNSVTFIFKVIEG